MGLCCRFEGDEKQGEAGFCIELNRNKKINRGEIKIRIIQKRGKRLFRHCIVQKF